MTVATWRAPVQGGYRTSAYGPRTSPGGVGSTWHRGVDVGGRGTDWLVRSVGPGYVLARGTNAVRGLWVAIRHDDDTTTAYQHLDEVRASGRVEGGTVLGVMGSTGTSTARHLHLEAFPAERWVRLGDGWVSTGRTVDPEPYLRARGVDLRTATATVAHPGSTIGGGLLPVDPSQVAPIAIAPHEEDSEMPRYLMQIDTKTDGRWVLVSYDRGEYAVLTTGYQIDRVRELVESRDVIELGGPQPAAALAGLRPVGELDTLTLQSLDRVGQTLAALLAHLASRS